MTVMPQPGHLYNPGRTTYPETNQLRLTPGFCELTMYLPSPTPQEIADVSQGRLQFACLDLAPHLLMFGFQFGTQQWWDCPFEVQRTASDLRGVPGVPRKPLPFHVTVVDAATGVLRAIRSFDMPTPFAEALRAAVDGQLSTEYDGEVAGRLQSALYEKYSTPEAMFRDMADAVCHID